MYINLSFRRQVGFKLSGDSEEYRRVQMCFFAVITSLKVQLSRLDEVLFQRRIATLFLSEFGENFCCILDIISILKPTSHLLILFLLFTSSSKLTCDQM